MATNEDKKSRISGTFNPEKSIRRARKKRSTRANWSIVISGRRLSWGNKMERVELIRKGLPYESIELIGSKANLSTKQLLQYLGLPQTTYNKKKREQSLLSGRDSEIVLVLSELLDFGLAVFNDEKDKFQRWLRKPNASLGNVAPQSLFDSLTGIQEVRNALNRLEYGNMA